MIALGVDGLWISFDDVGAGENAANVVQRVLELGARHQMTGRKIAITPPSGDYQYIDTEFNRLAASWGLADANGSSHVCPCADDLTMARQIGIAGLPGWWHNLVNMRGGFLHNGDVLCPLRKDWKPAYVNPQPLANGWHRPTYEQLRDAEKHTSCVLLWGVIGGWPEEYQLGDLGRWSWDPRHVRLDAKLRRSLPPPVRPRRSGDRPNVRHETLFPERLVPTAAMAILARIQSIVHRLALPLETSGRSPPRPWHCSTNWISSRKSCRKKPASKRPSINTLGNDLPRPPWRDTLDYARRMTLLDYPEYSATKHEQTMIPLILAES